jgi:dolichol kinase
MSRRRWALLLCRAAHSPTNRSFQVSGIVFYLSGILFSAIFFSPSITVLSSLVLGSLPAFTVFCFLVSSLRRRTYPSVICSDAHPGFADPAASACGIISGKRKFSGNKTLAGFYGFVIVSSVVLVIAHVLLFNADAFSWVLLKGCVLASIAGGISELFSGFLSRARLGFQAVFLLICSRAR